MLLLFGCVSNAYFSTVLCLASVSTGHCLLPDVPVFLEIKRRIIISPARLSGGRGRMEVRREHVLDLFQVRTVRWHLVITQIVLSLITSLVPREIRFELSLPAFNAANLVYPDFLPSPPLESIQDEDQAWYFYLAEIALRRLANKILSEVLPLSNADRICDLTSIAARMPEFENQAEQWYVHSLSSCS